MKNLTNLRKFVDGKPDSPFEWFIVFVIMVNIISLGFETSSLYNQHPIIFITIDQVCLWIFIIELIIKFIAYGKDFFKSRWNWFDFIIVIISGISSFSYFIIFKIFRVFRFVRLLKGIRSIKSIRILKLVDGFSDLRKIFSALRRAIPGILWTCVLLFIFIYMYAIIGTNCFNSEFPNEFGNLGRSILTLLQVMTFDAWFSGIARPVTQIFPWAWIYFVSFVLVAVYVVLNTIVGVIVDKLKDIDEGEKQQSSIESISKDIQQINEKLLKMEKIYEYSQEN